MRESLPDYAWESFDDAQWREHEAILEWYSWEPIVEANE